MIEPVFIFFSFYLIISHLIYKQRCFFYKKEQNFYYSPQRDFYLHGYAGKYFQTGSLGKRIPYIKNFSMVSLVLTNQRNTEW